MNSRFKKRGCGGMFVDILNAELPKWKRNAEALPFPQFFFFFLAKRYKRA